MTLDMPYRHVYCGGTVSPKTTTALRLDNDLLNAMRRFKETNGVPLTTQLEMAATEWLAKRGVIVKKTAKRSAQTPRKA